MQEEFAEQVYCALNGAVDPLHPIPGVENAFAEGEPCMELYCEALDAYLRICQRLGVGEEDKDVEMIFFAFMGISRILALKMYHYGAMFGEKQMTTPQSEIKDFRQLP